MLDPIEQLSEPADQERLQEDGVAGRKRARYESTEIPQGTANLDLRAQRHGIRRLPPSDQQASLNYQQDTIEQQSPNNPEVCSRLFGGEWAPLLERSDARDVNDLFYNVTWENLFEFEN